MDNERGPRVLIVDDEAAQVEALCSTLRGQGYEVKGCSNGEAGLAALREQSFDLLLSDLTMPGMDGIELMRRALAIDASLVAIIMTGAGTIDSAVEAMRSGALDYILKPFKLSAVLPVLERGLAIRRLRLENEALTRQLRERAAELEAANTELDAFTRSASHDLRTPLNAVIGFSSLLTARYGSKLPEEAQSWLLQIESAGGRMNCLIEDLLRLSYLGKQPLSLTRVDLQALVSEVLDGLRQAQATRHVKVLIEALPQVLGDAGLLQQVFVNLLSNAYKFTRDTADATITVGSKTQDRELVLFVRDNGKGFDMAQAHRLFGAFERLHTAEEFEGTGVGLSIVQRIVQRHGGRTWAIGEPGRGATFSLTLNKAADEP